MEYSIIFAVVILPFTYLPMLLVARDREYMGGDVNGVLADVFGWFYLIVITLAGSCAIPLMLMTHGGKG